LGRVSESSRHQLRGLGQQCKLFQQVPPSGVRGGAPGKLGFLSILDLKNYARTVRQIMFFFDTVPVSKHVVNEGADNNLNSVDSVLVDIENVVIM